MKMDQDYTEQSVFTLHQKQKQYAWSEELAIKSNTKSNYQWSFGAYGFYNSLNTDGPVIFKKDGLTGILQKHSTTYWRITQKHRSLLSRGTN